MKKILIIGDSLAMPRDEVKYEETWPFLLSKEFPSYHFIDKNRRASTTMRLTTEGGGVKGIRSGSDLLEYYQPNTVIIQVGITDCSPRYLSKKSLFYKILNSTPKNAQKLIYKYVKKFKNRKAKYSDVNIMDFTDNLNNYFNRCLQSQTSVIILSILPVTNNFVRKSPDILSSIEKYNKVINQLSNEFSDVIFLETLNQREVDEVAIDEFHINSVGHKWIFDKIKTYL